jgi:hypothetical protein
MFSARILFRFLFILPLAEALLLWGSVTGSISGVVTDPGSAVVPGASVVAANTETGITVSTKTDNAGAYNFPALAVGVYNVEISQKGFKKFVRSGVVIDVNSAMRVDAKLALGQANEEVTVASDAAHVETENTQMGEVIEGKKITSVPLVTRAFTDLLALQPGVSPYTDTAGTYGDRPVSGNLNAGNQSVNGGREASNGFMVNGANVEEGRNNGTAIVPNLDSISEFRIITSNFDAEYGNYSGGQVNVATKSGTNHFHGSAFEFLRNTDLNARNYFSPTRGVFQQNIFGGTFGGPLKKNKTFFFVDYQGTRLVQAPTVTTTVPSLADRTGDLSDQAGSLGGMVTGQNWANILSQRLGYTVTDGEAYFTPGCTDPTVCVFPNAIIPQRAWSPAAVGLLPFVPQPNTSNPTINFATSSFAQRLRDDKGAIHIDQNTRFGQISGYYFLDDYHLNNPYPGGPQGGITSGGGATVPGFSGITPGRAQLATLSAVKTFGSTAVNEFRFSYMRTANTFNKPSGGLGVTLASLGFTTPFTAPGGIAPINPALEGVPQVVFNNFIIGVPTVSTGQFNNTFQWLDNFAKAVGTHSFKFGGQFHYDQINERNYTQENGQFTFNGTETGSDFADFLIGAPSGFVQASQQILDSRSKYLGLYFQDSWKVRSNLTFNYGIRWEFSQPWYDTQNKIETIVPGLQSQVFPGAPTGWVVPGDPGIPRTLAPTQYDGFTPRLGFAYSPSGSSGWLAKLTGGPGKTSIRAGFGMYYTAFEDSTQFLEVGDPPYGLFYGSPAPPFFETPYIDRATGNSQGQRFPFVFPSTNVSVQNPNTTFDWAGVEPISFGFAFFYKNRMPYAEHYELSIQRQFGQNTVLTVGYVGTQGHRLLTSVEANPGDPALCLSLSDPASVAPNTPTCGPNLEGTVFTTASGQTVNGTRTILGANFGSNPYTKAEANSNYNSLQTSLRYAGKHASFLLGYTYSKCFDNASGLQDTTDPFNPALSRALCAFDLTHNFVGSYTVVLPFDRLVSADSWSRWLVGGWSLSGITRFSTGQAITLSENDDQSLLGVQFATVDLPNCSPGPILLNTNPRNLDASGNPIPYFNTSLFAQEPLGQLGNCKRRFFHGPGINNWDMALQKDTKLKESLALQFRAEAYNVFNHAQFLNPDALCVASADQQCFGSKTFGIVSSARDPRIMQLALKLVF